MTRVQIELVDAESSTIAAAELAAVLIDTVEGGASVGFLSPLLPAEAERWWRDAVAAPQTLTWVAREPGRPAHGVVQLKLVSNPNGAHRADVAKLMVHRGARGAGTASRLMQALETEALARGRWLLILDTETGSPAETLYQRWGWQRIGTVEDYAGSPNGSLISTTFMSKRLSGAQVGRSIT